MNSSADRSFRMKMREMETAFKYRRFPYPKRSVELIALLAISCTFFLFMHTNKLNSRLKEMEMKLQPSEFSALGLTGSNHLDSPKHEDVNTLHGTYQYLKSTGQHLASKKRDNLQKYEDGHILRRSENAHHHKPQNKQRHDSEEYNELLQDKGGKRTARHDFQNSDSEEFDYEDEYDDYLNAAADILNNTKKAEVEVVVFNRVPKVGSQSLMQLMIQLGKVNNFLHSRDRGKSHETIILQPAQQKNLIEEIYRKPRPHIYSQHLAYINFTRFHMPKPIYINLVRDPVERIISWHYYIRAEWYYRDMKLKLGDLAPPRPSDEFMNMDLDSCVQKGDKHCQFNQMEIKNPVGDHRRQTLFFCGQNRQLCMPFNSKAAMQKAKRTVEEDYAVVGTWEDTNITLSVFEHYIPLFFRNAKTVFHLSRDHLSQINKNKSKRPVSDLTKEILRKNLTHEIEFYEFCKQRLYLQYAAINDGENVDNDEYLMIPDHEDNDDDKALFTLSADQLNNTKKSNIDILFFNRVPKTGSVQLIALLRQLSKLHDYEVRVDPNDGGIKPSLTKQQVENTIENILNFGEGTAFVSHMNYLNFTNYGQPLPIYINMVRDPVERVISWYYYVRSPWIFVPARQKNNREMPNPLWVNMEFDQCVMRKEKVCTYLEGAGWERVGDHRRQTLFFCGHNAKKCMPFNGKLPLELAKRAVERDYAVVGTWEDTNVTLTVLENYVPRYFKGATKMYYNGLSTNLQNNNPFKPHISEEIKHMLRKNFTREIEFYQFCRQRLHKQYLALRKNDFKALAAKQQPKDLPFLKKTLYKLNF